MESDSLLVDVGEVARLLAVGQRTIWRWIATGDFPEPDVAFGRKFRRWRRATVVAWIDAHAGATAEGGGRHE